jgi:hypoxanthine-DNA glycosylase
LAKSSFPAVADGDTRVLILGSLPGEASLAAVQYYAHPQNQFWRLMAGVTGIDLPAAPYTERIAALLDAGVGLWDVVRSAERVGSLDAAIRNPAANPLAQFAATLPSLKAVAFNGGTAARIGGKRLAPDADFVLMSLPSSSPAYTAPFEAKLAAWLKLKVFLDPSIPQSPCRG